MSIEIDPQKKIESGEQVRDLVSAAAKAIDPVKIEVPVERTPKALSSAPSITVRRRRPTSGGRWKRRLVALAVLAIAGTAAAFYFDPIRQRMTGLSGPKTAVALANIQTYSAKRGELRITMVEEGKLRAVNNSIIRIGVNGKITWLADQGARVKKGDRLATVDAKQYEDQKRTQEGELETFIKQLEIAEKQIPMAEADGKAAISTAHNALGTAEVNLAQFTTVDVPKKLNEMEGLMNEARAKLNDQQKKRADLQTQLDQTLNEEEKAGIQNNLNVAKQTEASLRRTLSTQEDQHKMFRSYNYPQDLKTKQRMVENAKVDYEKAQIKAENDVLAKKADAQRIRNTITRVQSNIKQMEDLISKATAYATTDGLVFYGGQDARYGGMSPDQIRVGADWYSQYPIMTIPDLSSFAVEVPIAEVYRGRVSTGMTSTVTIDAVPGLVLEGRLTAVSSVSRPKFQYDNTSPPVYDATIALAVADERMVAGMTVRVEIVTASLPDVLYVPVEAVYNEEGKTASFFWVEGEKPGEGHVEIRPVLTGQSSDHFVELKKGVKENDKLLLSRPAAYVTPSNYREMVDVMFPASSAPVMVKAPATAPAMNPENVSAAVPTTRPTPRRGRGATSMPAGELSAGPQPSLN